MRYRLMASYLGASYQAAVGPSDRDVTLFAAPPPPEEHGFSPVPGGGIWRKQVRLDDLDGLWESRPIGSYHGEPCLVLDDLGDRLHIVYLGMDERRAGQLGYWQVDRGVFEVVVQRHEVTDLAEERHEFPIALLLSALPRASAPPRALNAGNGGAANGPGGHGANPAGRMALASGGPGTGPQGLAGQGLAGQGLAGQGLAAQSPGLGQGPNGGQTVGGGMAAWNAQPAATGAYQAPAAEQPPMQSTGQPMTASLPQAMSPPQAMSQAPTTSPQYSGPAQQYSGGAQLPSAQQAYAAPTDGAPSGAAQPPGGAAQSGMAASAPPQPMMSPPGVSQPGTVQPGATPTGTATLPGTGQAFAASTPMPAAQAATAVAPSPVAQPANGQPANAQPPSAVAAWHGSPVPDGNGTWYYQPNVDPQTGQSGVPQNGAALNGISQNVVPQNGLAAGGYAPFEPGTPTGAPTGLTATPQPPQQSLGTGYQPTPPLSQAPLPQAPLSQAPLSQAPLPSAAPQYQPPAGTPAAPAATAPVANAGTPGTRGTAAPVNLGLPLSGQVPLTPPAQAQAPSVVSPLLPSPSPASLGSLTVPPSQLRATGAFPAVATTTAAPAPAPGADEQSPRSAPAGPLGRLTVAASAVRGRRAARKPRLAMSAIFADLVDMADVPRSSYAVDEEVTGAMCLFKTDGGYEVFSCAEDARHEVRFFEDEEAAYFYLFGVLAAEALRNGRLAPRRGDAHRA